MQQLFLDFAFQTTVTKVLSLSETALNGHLKAPGMSSAQDKLDQFLTYSPIQDNAFIIRKKKKATTTKPYSLTVVFTFVL